MGKDLIQVVTDANAMPTKKDVYAAVIDYADRFVEGAVGCHPLKEYLTLKRIELFVTEALKQVQPWALQEANNYDKKELKEVYNSKITIKEGKKEYDYSGNEEWVKLSKEEEEYKAQVKMASNNKKALEENMLLAGTAKLVGEGKQSISVEIL